MPSEGRRLPTFLVIGAAKGGTTSLAGYLASHPDVFVTTPKEPRFFSSGWDKGLEWYKRLFDDAGAATARGEASTHYTVAATFPDAPKRISTVVPDARLIYSIRQPVERICSHYTMNLEVYHERRSLREAVFADTRYFEASRYGHQLDKYLEFFDREQILVISAEALRTDRIATLRRVFDFIGVDSNVPFHSDFELNPGSQYRRPGPVVDAAAMVLRRAGMLRVLSKRTKRRLRRRLGSKVRTELPPDLETEIWARLDEDLVRLREIVGPDFDLWGRA